MNYHGSRKVLQWKLDIQHYDAIIEHVPGVMNTPADVFSRLVEKDKISEVNHVMILTCSAPQWDMIKTNGCEITTESTGPYPYDTARSVGNVCHSMATTTTRRPRVHSMLRDMSEDGSATQGDSGVALCPIDP